VKDTIYKSIKDDVENQKKLIEALFAKAIKETSYSILYSKMCKELDRELPQKAAAVEDGNSLQGIMNPTKKTKNKTKVSIFRSHLVTKCKDVFKNEIEAIISTIKATDPEERAFLLKQFTLGST
jgi:hypothetical protein